MVDEWLVKERMGIPKGSEGAINGWITCDLTAAKDSVDAEDTKAGRDTMKLKDFTLPWKENEKSHEQTINALETAKTKISGCST
ncbi:hypothetical protein N7513_001089 [Penicillium frequentans]|nr:hypothetical protein N7513_001089 [Penicillium glabrum]